MKTYMFVPGAVLATLVGLGSPSNAGVNDVSERLREQAIQACTSDALRLCPATLPDEATTVACMAGHRAQLAAPCRTVYDRVVRTLKR